MRFFRCANCRALVRTGAEPGRMAICPNCNSRQPVPADAGLEEATAAMSAAKIANSASAEKSGTAPPPGTPYETYGAGRVSPRGEEPARYPLLTLAGYLLICIGPVILLIALIEAAVAKDVSGWALAGSGILNGLLVMGFGQLLHAVRDTARNSWR